LTLLAILSAGILAVSASAALFGLSSAALAISTINLLAFTTAAIVAWLNYGREVVPLGALFLVIPYIFNKLGLYRQIASGKAEARWIRTDRTKSE
jgi:hypothetical protein